MKTAIIFVVVLGLSATAIAGQWDPWGGKQNNPNYDKDSYGHYTKRENLYKDSDRDGVVNRYDYNDRNSSVQSPKQKDYYSTPNYNSNSSRGYDSNYQRRKSVYGY